MSRREHLRAVPSHPFDLPSSAGRVPPHDLDAEAAVLSAVLDGDGVLSRVQEVLRPEHFYSEANQRVYQAAQQAAAAMLPVDLITVGAWLRDRGVLEKVGGSAYLAQLADATPSVGNVLAHAGVVHEKARLRRLIATCQRVAAEGYADVGEDVQAFVIGAHDAIGEVRASAIGEDLDRFSIGSIAAESHAETLALQSPFEGAFVSTGIGTIDAITGLYPNQVAMLGAEKGLGKTTLARWISERVARSPRRLIDGRADCQKCQSEAPCSQEHGRQPRGVLVFALEGTRRDWSDYCAARPAKLNLFERANGRWTDEQHARFTRELDALKRIPIVVDDRKDLCRANLGARVRAWRDWFAKRGATLELVVLDYFQIGAWERGGDSREADLSDAGRNLIRLATDSESDTRGMAWLVITALNKDGATRESGALEYHADTVWRLSAGKTRTPDGEAKALYLWVEKQRRGPSKTGVSFWFDPALGNFW
jgi:replicative DNA helicase